MTGATGTTGPRHAEARVRRPLSKPALRGDIEGLRAVAVLLVLLYHLGFSAFSGGFAGVDVFFVISGFLITSHLLSEAEKTGTVRLGRFYARRAKRLLPAATVVLVFTAVVGYLVLPVVERGNLATDVFLAAVYVVNWGLAARSVDYLAEDAGLSPVQHFWSLSVEEQFYLVVPVLLIALAWLALRRGGKVRRLAGWTFLGITLLSLSWSVWLTAVDPATAYFVSTTRVWELAVGSLLACVFPALRLMTRWVAQLLALGGAVLLAWTAFLTDTSTPWPGSAALLPVLGTALVIAAGCRTEATIVARVLGVRPMVWIGGLSYAIYLWHWPLIVFADTLGWHGPAATVGLVVLTLALSAASRRFVEDPIRFGTALSGASWRALAMGATGMAVSIAAAAMVWATVPALGEVPSDAQGAQVLDPRPDPTAEPGPTSSPDPDPTPEPTTDPSAPVPGLEPPSVSLADLPTTGPVFPAPEAATRDIPDYYDDGCQASQRATEPDLDCVYGDPESDVVVAVVGDSKIGQWMSPLTAIAEAEGWRLELYLKSACGLNPAIARARHYPECGEFVANAVDHLTAEPGRVDLVIGSMGTSSTSAAGVERFAEGHLEVWRPLEEAGATIVMLTDNPSPVRTDLVSGSSVYECVALNLDDWSGCSFSATESGGTPAILAAARQMPSVSVIDLTPWVCLTDQCPPVIGEILVYRQGSHITDAYARTLQEVLWRHLQALGVAAGPDAVAAEGS